MTDACAWAGKTGGAIWVCLDFFAPPFVSRQKVEKNELEWLIEKVHDRCMRCRIKSGMTAERG